MIEIERYYPDKGYSCWVIKGTFKFHREDGPAREWINGSAEWWNNDQLHRIDGPAKIYFDFSKNVTYGWCLFDKNLDSDEVEKWIKTNNKTWPFDKETQVEFLLRFS